VPAESNWPETVHRAIRHSLFAGGKRLRPILCMAAAEALGAPAGIALAPACGFELLHTYSLVHDDLPAMDDAPLRRGAPTSHVVFGEAVAILARGYAVAYREGAKSPLLSASSVEPGERIRVRLHEGELRAIVRGAPLPRDTSRRTGDDFGPLFSDATEEKQ